MVEIAYFDFLVIASGLGTAGSQWCFFTLEGSGLPLAVVAGWGVAACVGPLCLADRVLEGHFLGSLPHAAWRFWITTWSILWVANKLGT